ncbi:MAG: hypothetical protein K8T89_19855 [Planctomycetes bacterium]|nr:hypothetical protein [Planctomycetota bacterium]
MRVELYGLLFETPEVSFQLWSPWRASAIEHKLFDAIRQLPQARIVSAPDELTAAFTDAKSVRSAILAVERILKGWQEEASDSGSDRRTWRWLIEADTDSNGYDHAGERASLWAFLRLTLERSAPGETEKAIEDIDMNGFGMRIGSGEEK